MPEPQVPAAAARPALTPKSWHHWLTASHPIDCCSTCRAVREAVLEARRLS